MKKVKMWIQALLSFIFYKVDWVSDKNNQGFVLKKRLGSMLVITPIALIVIFILKGLSGFKGWYNYITTYDCRYLWSHKIKLTLRQKINYVHYFVFQS